MGRRSQLGLDERKPFRGWVDEAHEDFRSGVDEEREELRLGMGAVHDKLFPAPPRGGRGAL